MNLDVVVAFATLGATSSLHCAFMCGPIAACAAPGASASAAMYHLARVLSYGAVGACLGGVGSFAPNAVGQPILRVLPALVALVLAAQLFGFGPKLRSVPILGRPIARAMRGLASWSPVPRAAALGALTPLLPCGLLASVVVLALASGSVALGGASMLAFGVATLPALLGAQLGWASLKRLASGSAVVWMERGFAVIVAVVLCARVALATTGADCH